MSDQAHDWTDDRIDELSVKFQKQYERAAKEMQAKLDTWLEDYDRRRKVWEDDVSSGRRTQDDYDAWLKGRAFDKSWQQEMIDTLSYDAMNTDRLAMDAINDELPRIYAENANFTAYTIDKGIGMNTGFTLVDQDTVRRLMMDNPDLVPAYRIDQPKDYVWNQQKFNSAITQGILQGESIPAISKRVESVIGMDKRAATRSARTACTAAESMGRQSSYKRAQELGIGLKQQWIATLDLRTRYTHRLLDKQTVQIGHKFCPKGYGEKYALRFPADPQGLAEMVFGCRCTTIAVLDDEDYEDDNRWSKLPDGMTYEEWKNEALQDKKNNTTRSADVYTTEDIGMKPTRPRRSDFATREEYVAAREKYRHDLDEFEVRKRRLIDEIISRPNHGYMSDDSIAEWSEKTGVKISDDALKQVDRRILDESAHTLDSLFKKYPQVLENYRSAGKKFTIDIEREGIDCIMEATGGLNISVKHIPTYEFAVENTVNGYTTSTYNEYVERSLRLYGRGDGTFATQVTHEFGHNLDHAIRQKFIYTDEYGDAAFTHEYDSYRKELLELTKKHTTSDYSLTNQLEAFAEGFAAYECNPQSEYAKAFGEFLRRWL